MNLTREQLITAIRVGVPLVVIRARGKANAGDFLVYRRDLLNGFFSFDLTDENGRIKGEVYRNIEAILKFTKVYTGV